MFVNIIVLDCCNYCRPFVFCFWFDMEGQNGVRNMVHGNGIVIVIGLTYASDCDEFGIFGGNPMYHKYSILKMTSVILHLQKVHNILDTTLQRL